MQLSTKILAITVMAIWLALWLTHASHAQPIDHGGIATSGNSTISREDSNGTRHYYFPDGRPYGSSTIDSAGTRHYYDAQDRSLGSSSTDSAGTVTHYDAQGRIVKKESIK